MSRPLLTLLALGALALGAAPAAADPVPAGYEYSDHWYESKVDGAQQHAGVFMPADHQPGEKHPVILTITPYASPNGGATAPGNLSGPVNRFPELFETGLNILEDRYVYIQVDARSFGGSGGCFEYYGPNEAKDAGQAVEWAAAQEWSNGKVALYGKSYDAATQVLAMAERPQGLAATIVQAPGLSGYTALWYNGVHYARGRYATTPLYTADDLGPTQNEETLTSQQYAAAFADGVAQDPRCRVDAVVGMNVFGNRADPFWAGREPYLGAKGSTVPTFWSHGFYDANTKPVHMDVWEALAGPKKAWFGQYTHLRGQEGGVGRNSEFLGEVERWLDFYVLGRGEDPLTTDPVMTIQERSGDGEWRSEAAWPPADAAPWAMDLKPGSYVDKTGNSATSAGQGLWTFTPELPHDAHLAGEAEVALDVSTLAPGAVAVAHLYDYDPEEGRASFVQRGASVIRGTGAQTVTFKLYPQDHRFLQGHRIAVRLSASDDAWWTGGVTQTNVTVAKGTLTLPLLANERVADLEGGPSNGMTNPFAVPAATVAAGEHSTGLPPAQNPAG